MTDRETDLRRAASLVHGAIAVGPDDDEHPAYEQLEALVDGRLDDADQEALRSHLERCQPCSEDVSDLSAMRDTLRAVPPGAVSAPGWRPWMVAAASIAAVLIMAVWFSERGAESPAPVPVANGPRPETAPAAVNTSALTANERAIVAQALDRETLDLPVQVTELGGTVGTLLGQPRGRAPLSPIAPAGTVVMAARPAFSWQPLPGAISYTVAVYDERFIEVARSPRLNVTAWTPAEDLPAGRPLAWQITAQLAAGTVTGPAPPQPEARFRVIDAATAAIVADQLSRLSNEPVALGVLLAQAGLLDEAARVLERAAADPATQAKAQALLTKLKAR